MLDRELVKRYIVEFHERGVPEVKPRELRIEKVKNKATCIVGPRRAGKTYYLFSLIKKVEDYLYVDFENPVFYNASPKDIITILDAYKELYDRDPIVLLDEVQNVPDWERMVRYLLDKGLEVYVTGSSSKLLSKEIATHLRGRSLTYRLLTLSFREFLTFKGIDFRGRNFYKNYNRIRGAIEEYLHYGGYPEVVLSQPKERILKEYLELIIKKDILERFRIRNIPLINELIYYTLNNYAGHTSYDSLHRLLGQRTAATKRTIINYLSHLEDAMYITLLRRYTPSLRQRIAAPRKIYLIDTGYALFGQKDVARDMENAVLLELLRRHEPPAEIYYFHTKEGYEVDFLVKQGGRIAQLINVTYAKAYDEVDRREIRALLHAYEQFKQDNPQLTIITWDYEDQREHTWYRKRGVVTYVPLWKWLLNT